MMCDGNEVGIERMAHFLKPSVSQLTCSHLKAYALLLFVSKRVEMLYMKWDAKLLAKLCYEHLVAIRLLASKMKVAMQGFDVSALLMQCAQ